MFGRGWRAGVLSRNAFKRQKSEALTTIELRMHDTRQNGRRRQAKLPGLAGRGSLVKCVTTLIIRKWRFTSYLKFEENLSR